MTKKKEHRNCENFWLKTLLYVSQSLTMEGDQQSLINLTLERLQKAFNMDGVFLYDGRSNIYYTSKKNRADENIVEFIRKLTYRVSTKSKPFQSLKNVTELTQTEFQKLFPEEKRPEMKHVIIFPHEKNRTISCIFGFLSLQENTEVTPTQKLAGQQLAKIFNLFFYSHLKKDIREYIPDKKQLISNAAIKMLVNPVTNEIIEANEAAIQFYGYDFNGAKTYYINEISLRSDADIAFSHEQIFQRKTYKFASRHKTSGGAVKDVDIYSGLIINNGEPVIYNIIHDVTDKKIVEEKLKKERFILDEFIKHTPAAVALFDKDFRYQLVSERWYRDYELDRSIIGQRFTDSLPEIPKELGNKYKKTLNGVVEHCENDYYVNHKGKRINIRWELYPVYTYMNEVDGILMFSETINRSNTNPSFHQKLNFTSKLETIERERKKLANEIQEGLGQLLTATHFNLELIKDETSKGKTKVYALYLKKLVETTIEEISKISQNLHPSLLNDYGLKPALKTLCNNTSKSRNISVNFDSYNLNTRCSEKFEITVYRLCEDIFKFLITISGLKEIYLQIFNRSETLFIEFQYELDDNQHFEREDFINTCETGLADVKDRIELFNGQFELETNSRNSLEVIIELPIDFLNS